MASLDVPGLKQGSMQMYGQFEGFPLHSALFGLVIHQILLRNGWLFRNVGGEDSMHVPHNHRFLLWSQSS